MDLWKESIVFPDAELYAESFEKNLLKKSNISQASQTLKSRCDHKQPYNFFSVLADLWTLPGSGVPRPELVGRGGRGGEGVKPLVYR